MRRTLRWALVLAPALALLLSGCIITEAPAPLEVTYRVTKTDAAFVTSVAYRAANGQIRTTSPSTFPWAAVQYFEFGEPVSLAVDAQGTASEPVTIEVVVVRRSTGTELSNSSLVCTAVCDADTFRIEQTLATSAMAAQAEEAAE